MHVQHVHELYFLIEKNPALFNVQRYVLNSLLKHYLTRVIVFPEIIENEYFVNISLIFNDY